MRPSTPISEAVALAVAISFWGVPIFIVPSSYGEWHIVGVPAIAFMGLLVKTCLRTGMSTQRVRGVDLVVASLGLVALVGFSWAWGGTWDAEPKSGDYKSAQILELFALLGDTWRWLAVVSGVAALGFLVRAVWRQSRRETADMGRPLIAEIISDRWATGVALALAVVCIAFVPILDFLAPVSGLVVAAAILEYKRVGTSECEQ